MRYAYWGKDKYHGIGEETLNEGLLEKLKKELRDLSDTLDKENRIFRWAR